ncbi:hypothetical protein Glove_8g67 [Diversispora epigaea]|uniref:Restriction endonuclease type IV Mrr domain-containing protein n=1 Tax=Diversispora epigaea TaxID=1348612 RepID=A0A397JVF3_9GLOM|nr:hypothetical protein Glove_8g67 [Diversispora epigaea]
MTKFQQEENSPVQKNKNFEMKIEKLLTDANIKCEKTGGLGDKGIDIKGMKKGVKFIIECKNWRTKNIDRSIINQIEGVLSRQSNGTIVPSISPPVVSPSSRVVSGVSRVSEVSGDSKS